ncbi:DUF11 domain-containing protein [Streptomyces sp. L2]|uniref:DUF11 domain-containing protein n=1 Tax=Streptomyces sp. L2 TaxID=2162665 RepID=UPI001011801C|nr:DUF11 domain-containing protein [Streptomyces sp. L2]
MNRNLSRRLLTIALTVGGVVEGALGLAVAPHAMAAAPDGFACKGQIFQPAGSTTAVRLYQGTEGQGVITFSKLGPTGPGYNASGVDPKTRYVFVMNRDTDHLLRINETGSVTDLGAVAGLPHKPNYYIGGFDSKGYYYVAGNDTPLYKIDVSKRKVVSKIPLSSPLGKGAGDITYSSGYFWTATAKGKIQRINAATGKVADFFSPVPMSAGKGVGGAFTYGNNDLGFFDNGGKLYRIAVKSPGSSAPTFTLLSSQNAAAGSAVDATACFLAHADLKVTKTHQTEVNAGGAVTYTITVTNNGPSTSSGWTVRDTLPRGLQNPVTSSPGCQILNRQLSCTGGKLAVGDSTTITVTGTAPRPGGVRLDNIVTVWGNDPDPLPQNNTTAASTRVIPIPLIDPSVGAVTAGAVSAVGMGFVRRRRNAVKTAG